MATFRRKLFAGIDRVNKILNPIAEKAGDAALDFSGVRPFVRLLTSAKLSAQGKKEYRPQVKSNTVRGALERVYLGQDESVPSFGQWNRNMNTKITPYVGAEKAKYLAPALMGLSAFSDLVPLGVDDIGKNIGKRAGKEAFEQIEKRTIDDQVKLLDKAIKSTKDWGKRAEIMKKRDELMDLADPARKAVGKELSTFNDTLKAANKDRAQIQKQTSSVTDKLTKLKQDINTVYDNKNLTDIQKKAEASKLYREKENLERLQKQLLQESSSVTKKLISAPSKIDAVAPTIKSADQYKELIQAGKKTAKVDDIIKPKDVKTVFSPARDKFVAAYKNLVNKFGDNEIIERLEKGAFKGTPEAKALKQVTDELYETTKKLVKERTGKELDIGKVEDYLPRIYSGSYKDVGNELGDNMMDIAESFYSPLKGRTSALAKAGYVKDPEKIIDDYISGIAREFDGASINAAIKGTNVDGEKVMFETAKKIGESVKTTGKAEVDVISSMREASKAFGDVDDAKVVVPKLNIIERGLYDDQLFLDELKLTEPLKRFLYSDYLASNTAYQIKDLVKQGRLSEASAIAKSLLPEFDAKYFANYIMKVKQHGGDIESATANFMKKAYRNVGVDDMRKFVSKLEFADSKTAKRFNSVLNEVLSSDAKTKDMATNIIRGWRRHVSAGLLGLNVSPAIQNLSEVRRLAGVVAPQHLLGGLADAWKQTAHMADDSLVKYGLSDVARRYDDVSTSQLTNAVADLGGKYDKVLDATMLMFRKTESLKNRAFVAVFERDGIAKGLSGKELQEYVIRNFHKYAIPAGKLSATGLIRGEKSKTLLQFGQYPARELGILLNKAKHLGDREQKSLEYLIAFGLNTYLTYKAYEHIGMPATAAIPSVPGARGMPDITSGIFGSDARKEELANDRANMGAEDFAMGFVNLIGGMSPTAQITVNSAMVLADYLGGANKEKWGELSDDGMVDDYLEYKLKKDMKSMLVPGGNQLLNKTGNYVLDFQQGYNSTVTGDKVRFPITTDPTSVAKGILFGSHSTDTGAKFWEDREEQGKYLNLSQSESDKFREIFDTKGREPAFNYWQDMYGMKMPTKDDPEADMMGVAKAADKYSNSNLSSITSQVLLKDAKDDEAYGDIKSFDNDQLDMLKKGDITEQDYEQRVSDYAQKTHGWTIDEYRNRIYAGSDLTAKQKAEIVKGYIDGGKMDIASWYKNKLLTLEVAKELERSGVIPNADELWDNAQMTDPYYKNKELRKLREKTAKTKAKAVVDILKAKDKYRKTKTKGYKPRLTTRVSAPKSLSIKLKTSKPTKYTAKSLKTILNKIKAEGETTFKL